MPPKSLHDFAIVAVITLKRMDSQLVVCSLQAEGHHLGWPIGQFISASDTSNAFSAGQTRHPRETVNLYETPVVLGGPERRVRGIVSRAP